MHRNMEEKTKKNDIILIVALLIIALMTYLGVLYFQGKSTKDGMAVVSVGGEEYGRYPLIRDVTERIELPDGSYNILQIREGKADVTEASCPDGICVRHRAVHQKGQSIVCLPNRLVVEIVNGKEAEVDAVTH